jgi:tetratricopeptide (TPR) repeat protein
MSEGTFSRGVTLLEAGNPTAALQEFQKSLADATGAQKGDSLYNIAICHVRLGNVDAAVHAIAEAVTIDPALAEEISRDEDFAALAVDESFRETLESARRRVGTGADSGPTEFVYRSTYRHEVDMVAASLERAGIAFHRAEERTGARFSMPMAAAAACLPGAWYLVIVPAALAARARAVVSSLPVSHDE